MLVNSKLTVYHKGFDEKTRLETWTRYNYGKEDNRVWFYGGKGASTNEGYENANDVKIRIPYEINTDLNIKNFKIGDIIVQGYLGFDIKTQSDLKNYDIYNITSLVNNNFGNNQHIYIGGK